MGRLKESIGKRVLKKKLKGFERQVHVHNFETAKSAVLLFDANEATYFPQIKEFRKFIEGKGIRVVEQPVLPGQLELDAVVR